MWKKSLSAAALVAMWLLAWETAFRISGKRDWQFPPPLPVVEAFWAGLRDGSFLWSLSASLLRAIYGFLLALGIGAALGLLLSTNRFFQWLLGPLVLGIQSLPSICWLPVSILWFGLNDTAILFIVLMGSVGSITIATRDGLSQIPLTYRRVAGTFGASFWQRLCWVSVPAALPVFISGLKQGWSFAWRSLLAGELIRDVVGVGGLLTKSRDLNDYARMFASMILILLVSVLADKVVFSNLERHVRARWGG
jgi:NitT/TauT family transport system permease protein